MKILYYNASLWLWEDINLLYSHKPSHGKTTTSKSSWVESMNGLITNIGYDQHPFLDDSYTQKIDCRGGLLLPGLIDAHIHVQMTGESKYFLDLSNCKSIEQLQLMLKEHITNHSDISWIQGVNWDQSKLSRYPTRHDLDVVCQDKPVFLWRTCWHIGVANTKALRLTDIELSCITRQVEGGAIDYDNHGPTGILRERAVELITSVMGEKTMEEKRKFILDGLNLCMIKGLTSVQTNDSEAYHIYTSLRDSNELKIRVFLTPNHSELLPNGSSYHIADLKPFNHIYESAVPFDSELSYFSVDRVKLYSDGSLGAETAAIRLILPYENTSDLVGEIFDEYKGILVQPMNDLVTMISYAKSLNYRLEIHAIGDAAAEQVITALEKCENKPSDRSIITHCQVLGPDLIERMFKNGIIANIQPSFVPTDMNWVSNRISPIQQKYSYAWKTLIENSIHVAGGSDSPIETCSPFVGIYDAIYRRNRNDTIDNTNNSIFRPEECLSFSEALYVYTIGAAYASRCENVLGAIAINYAADMVLVDPRIVTDNELLATTQPWMVITGGKPVYRNESFLSSSREEEEQRQGQGQDNHTENKSFVNGDNAQILKGPFIPGKGGLMRLATGWTKCSCLLLGRKCDMELRRLDPEI